MYAEFIGKVALVTGAGSGIGKACALRFASEGARVVVSDIDDRACDATAAEIKALGGQALSIPTDVSIASDVERMVARTLSTWGRLDSAVNNAGITGPYKPLADLTEEEWDRTLSINLKSAFLCMKHEIAAMLETGGSIVNTASTNALRPITNQPDYQAAKAGLIALTRNVAAYYGDRNIRANALLPGATATPMLLTALARRGRTTDALAARAPLGRIGTSEDLANAAVWLCSQEASYVTGTNMIVDGGAVVA
jgi:NAD(P)-dependent dehydrogenase (short-subunit alcohol dehydrogenase family)